MCAEYFPGLMSRISGIGVHGIQQKAIEIHKLGGLGKIFCQLVGFTNQEKLVKHMHGKRRLCI